jgi:hypothetical protein
MGVTRYNVPLAASLPHIAITCLQTQLGTTPVTTPGVPLDGVYPYAYGSIAAKAGSGAAFWQSVRLVINVFETAVEKKIIEKSERKRFVAKRVD